MAEQIPYGVASSIIDRLASAAFRELGLIYGVRDEFESLKTTVESIKAVLLDAEERQERDHAVQIWITRLKDVLYPADDLLDEFSIEDMRHKLDAGHKNKVKEVFHFLSPTPVAFRLKFAHKIEKIRKDFNDVVQEMSILNLSPRVVVVKQSDSVRRETSSFVLESDIIGREDSKKEIISKTALAQLVYNDVEVQNFFEKRMWVCVSDNFDVKTIVKKMLELLTNSQIGDESLEKLQTMLRENLTGKRYLLVLDDIWSESHEKWAQLRTYLMCGTQDSKILVTSRSKIVARTMGVNVPYVLNGLTTEESWDLLKKITFGDDTMGVNQTLESIGKKIAEKCRGVPLAIRTLGGVLQNKNEESEWIGVLQGDFWKLCEEEDSIMPVLKLSYQNLLPQQRQCFAYCSLYPKDWEIEKDDLIQLWMAQGYLECSTEKQLMEDVGNQIVKVFLMKSFFQDAKMNEHGDIMCFKMHDLMHDLAMHVGGNDCCYLDGEAKRLVERPMHLSLEMNAIHLLSSLDAITNIVEISLSVCRNFRYLPPLERLPFLKSLSLHFLDDLEYIYYKESFPGTFFPSLERLIIFFCQKLKGWCRIGDESNDTNSSSNHLLLPPFPRLSYLCINNCSMLIHMPTFPNLDKSLELSDCSMVPLEATLNIAVDFIPFSMLKSLHIGGSQTFHEIEIWFKDNHNRLHSLQKITFSKCKDLKALPDWICNLSTLQCLKIVDCKDLALLPEGMSRLTNLQTLEIMECPFLIEECQTKTSATWPKIAHIPNIIIKYPPFG
ncbi:Virus X resistance protein-like, coiled-coil domain [Sesbania bispinosa]|nr:Virus X resistance protein-like, coiled-coil domain [Sesbania bispinosa]